MVVNESTPNGRIGRTAVGIRSRAPISHQHTRYSSWGCPEAANENHGRVWGLRSLVGSSPTSAPVERRKCAEPDLAEGR